MSKNLILKEEARKKLVSGAIKVADATGVTLGPCGRLVLIEKPGRAPIFTKDGVSVAKEIELEDPIENMGAQATIEVTSKTNSIAGDNTTTSAVLSKALCVEGMKANNAGIKPLDLKNGMEKATIDVVEELTKLSKPVNTTEEVINVGTISANNDPTIGNIIGEVVKKVGKDGVVLVEESNRLDISVKTVDGLKFEKGWTSPYFTTNKERMETEFENSYILLTDANITSIGDLLPILEKTTKEGKPLTIICDKCEEGTDALNTLVINSIRNIIKVCVIEAPSYGEKKRDYLEDIAVLTGATVVNTNLGMSLKNTTVDMLGVANIKATKDETTITNGSGDKAKIEELIATVKTRLESSEEEFEKKRCRSRLARLNNGVAIVSVGGLTDSDRKEKKYRVEDTIAATKAALEEGILPGGGVALVRAGELCKYKLEQIPVEERRGYEILLNSLSSPLKQISENAGVSGDVVLANILSNKDSDYGYNAKTNVYCKMVENGIIDTLKGIKNALINASTNAVKILTTDCCITEIPKKDEPLMATPVGMMPA